MIDSPAIKGKVTQIQLGSTLEGYTFHPLQTSAFHHQIDFSGKHSAMLQLPCEEYSLSIARYSTEGIQTWVPSIESGILPPSYCASLSDNYHNMSMSAHTHVDLFMCNMSCLNMSKWNESNWHDQIVQSPSGTNLACKQSL